MGPDVAMHRSMLSKEFFYAYGRDVLALMIMEVRSGVMSREGAASFDRRYEVTKGMQGGKQALNGGFDCFGNANLVDFGLDCVGEALPCLLCGLKLFC